MKILFVGTKMQGYFISEECKSRKWTLDYIETTENMELEKYLSDILAVGRNGYDYIVYDTTSCISDADVIAHTIASVVKSNNIKPIIIVNTLNAKNAVVAACINQSLRSFINKGSGTASDFKEQFVYNVTEFYEKVGREDVEEVAKEVTKSLERVKNTQTIGVAGACRRIGTTTQAIQIAKYLNYKGYRACIIEMNNIKYPNVRQQHNNASTELSFFEKTSLLLDLKIYDKSLGYIQVEGVDVYYKPDKLNEILEKGYDFQVFDYGVYFENAFNKAAFLKDDIQIFAAGFDVSELDYLIDILDNSSYKESKIIFSFVSEQNKSEVKSLLSDMNKDNKSFFFADYTPDPYILSNAGMLDDVFHLDSKAEEKEVPKKKRKGFLGRRK